MKYRNKKTGAIVETDTPLSKAWEVVTDDELQEQEIEVVEEQEEVIEDDKLKGITKKMIMEQLEALGVDYNPSMKKAELAELMYKKRW